MALSDSTVVTPAGNETSRNSLSIFIVEVRYREPSYEIRHGARAEPYRFRYRLEAPSEHAAIASVVAEFERMNVLSSVGWTRQIVELVVEPLAEKAGPGR